MARVFITRRIHEAAERTLRDAGHEVVVNEGGGMTPDELAARVREFDAIICMLSEKITRAILEQSRARIFANYAVGFDNLDVAAATELGIALSNTPDVLTDATAELAWTLLFAAARHAGAGERLVRRGDFRGWQPMMLLGYEVKGRTLGIVGAGRIGTAMALRSTGFSMRVLYTKRSGQNRELDAIGGKRVELDELLRESDFVSIHAPLTAETCHMISDAQFAVMRPNAVLVNTGRGPVVDEAALVRALKDRRIAAAGLDVYEREPEIEAGLFELENAVLLPHLGSATFAARGAMAELAANNIVDFFSGRVPRTCINPGYVKTS